MEHRRLILIYFCLWLLSVQHSVAQKKLMFFPVTGKNSVSDQNIRNINQLPDGRMVFVTEGLLNVYNGSDFQYIHLNAKKNYPLSGYFGFHHSYADSEGRLWIKNYKSLLTVDLRSNRFEIKPDSLFQMMGVKERIADFFMDDSKNFWLLTAKGALVCRNTNQKITTTFLKQVYQKNPGDLLYDLTVFKDQLFLFYKSGCIVSYDLHSHKELSRSSPAKTALSDCRTLYVVQGKTTMYVLGNGKKGVMLAYDPVKRNWCTVMTTDYTLNTLSIDDQGNVFVSCRYGIWSFTPTLQSKRLLDKLYLTNGRSVVNEVSTLYCDAQGGFWLGTLNRGLLYSHKDRFRFKTTSAERFKEGRSADFAVTTFCQTQNSLLIGTTHGIYAGTENHHANQDFHKISSLPCNNIWQDPDQRIWVCSDQGLFQFQNGAFRLVNPTASNGLCIGSDRKLYVATEGEALLMIDPVIGKSEKVELHNLQGESVRHIRQIVKWKNWLVGVADLGIFVFDPASQRSIAAKKLPRSWSALVEFNNQQFNCIYADSRGLLWVGTQDGLHVWNESDGKLQSFYRENGLEGNMVKGILEDPSHTIWAATANGLSQINVVKKAQHYNFTFHNYNALDGLLEQGSVSRSIYLSDRGTLYLGGQDGFNHVALATIPKTAKKLVPQLISFELFGKEVKPGASINGSILLSRGIGSTKIVQLKHDQNFIGFSFSAFNYVNPAQTHYQYQLQGVDQEWQTTQNGDGIGRATYTNLSPGTYLFKVRATDNHQNWNGNITTLEIMILPPWWLTWIAISSYILCTIGLVFSLFTSYHRQLKIKHLKQQREELDQLKFNFITNLSHELRTPLTLILTPLNAILNQIEDQKFQKQLKGIYHNALNLLGLVNQLLDFRRLEFSGETLNLSYSEIETLIQQVCESFSSAIQLKQIKFTSNIKIDSKWMYVDEDKLRKIIGNLLSNAIKFTPSGGRIKLIATDGLWPGLERKALKIAVQDNGCGIPAEDIDAIFERFFQSHNQTIGHVGSGIGLHLVKNYTTMHQGQISVTSEQGQLTEFMVLIPTDLKERIWEVQHHSEPTARKEFKILVIEDHEGFRDFLQDEIGKYYQVITASNGREGLKVLAEELPDLIISDITMPELDGLEFCKIVKTDIRTSHIPIVILTAQSSESSQLEGYDLGADAYIFKPFNLNILLSRIRNLIEQQQQRKELFKKAIILEPHALTVNNVDEKLIQQALKAVEANLSNTSYTVEQFSFDMNMDRTGLYRKLMAVVGQTPSEFIKAVRLKRAAQLILSRTQTISEIATMVGFNHVSHFSKSFSDEYGVSPSQFGKDATLN